MLSRVSRNYLTRVKKLGVEVVNELELLDLIR